MMRGMFAAISGLRVNQIMLDTTANDLANVNTIGYKSSRTTFQDSLAQLQRGASGATTTTGGSNAAQVGLGVRLGSIDNQMTAGSLQSTGNPLDVAIQGPGWFRVGSGTPPTVPTNPEYTRAGNFTTNTAGYLTTQDGHYVIGRTATATGTPPVYSPGTTDGYLQIPSGATDVSIGQDGSVSYVPGAGGNRVTAGYLSLATFPNEGGLERAGGSLWSGTQNSGAESVGTPSSGAFGTTVAGAVEMSNVDLATQFTTMITAQRGFQANSRVITTADEMLSDLVNMKR